uniref:Aldehyde dehydrogenase domain-containing protein n=1 Tax=Pavo cristatus TaxID=9049 RepID=A0A8C9L0R1_PAVCR
AAWLSGKTRPLEYRVAQLEALGRFLEDKKQDILEATALDMGKPSFEAYFTEILLCKNELNHTLNNLSHWMKDEHVDKNLVTQLDSAFIRKDPYGVVLIIAPWNYPIHLFLVPLIGAIAAGNCVVIKPSEISKNTERLVAEMLTCYLDSVRSSPCPCHYPACGHGIPTPAHTSLHAPASRPPCCGVLQCLLRAQPVSVIRAAQGAANGDRDRLAQADADTGIFPFTLQDCFAAGATASAPRPLLCSPQEVNQVLERTSSGGFCGNDTLMHVTLTSLPFGGVGNSGLGKYHGKFTFDTFSHHRSCLHRNMGLEAINSPRYPPYTQQKLGLMAATFEIKRKGMCTLL